MLQSVLKSFKCAALSLEFGFYVSTLGRNRKAVVTVVIVNTSQQTVIRSTAELHVNVRKTSRLGWFSRRVEKLSL